MSGHATDVVSLGKALYTTFLTPPSTLFPEQTPDGLTDDETVKRSAVNLLHHGRPTQIWPVDPAAGRISAGYSQQVSRRGTDSEVDLPTRSEICHMASLKSDVIIIREKELIQNAEDAEASKVRFLYDRTQYGTRTLHSPKLSPYQGPALCAYNDKCFTEQDWNNIQNTARSVKKGDPMKIGRFGLGFNSVYHLTECVKKDIRERGLAGVNPLDRAAWRSGVKTSTTSRLLPTPVAGTTAVV
ncbi:hypothetical protein Bbelb_141900 [Branchiostoma belcheri]|nr:hypothetical protein Bbelb_141900 [Branchiostoma belcheri]